MLAWKTSIYPYRLQESSSVSPNKPGCEDTEEFQCRIPVNTKLISELHKRGQVIE